jgi:hypothetical protein
MTSTSPSRAAKGTVEVPFRCILRAREEADLVKLMLRRHREGRLFDRNFVASQANNESTLGEFPSRCYGTVRVCFSCFCVYDLIERARKWDETNMKMANNHRCDAAVPQRQDAVSIGSDSPLKSNSHAAKIGMCTSMETPETCAMIRVQHAISCLSTLDIAELRSYVSPPLAVEIVTTALFVLLTGGRTLRWAEARHAMANGETFLQTAGSPRVLFIIDVFCSVYNRPICF